MTRESPGSGTYDVVVVGSGVGALTAAALLAAADLGVLVVEAGATAGGYARARKVGPYTFDTAVHTLSDPALFGGLLHHLGVEDRCEQIPVDSLYAGVVPGGRFIAPLGDADAFAEAHVAMRPSAADQIRRFFDICHGVHTQAHLLPQQAGLAELDAYAAALPLAFAHRRSTVADVLDAEVPDPVARSLCGLGSMLLGLPPSRLSLQTLAQSLYTYVVDGGFMFRGGVQSFIDALVESIERRGGEVAVGQAVTAITVEEDRASGVVLEDGRSVRARHVVSNADVGTTFGQLLNAADRPQAIQRKLRRLTVGSSSVVLHAAVALEAAADSPMVVASGTDLERSYAATAAGDPEAVVMWLPSLVDPTLAPAGEQVAAVCAFTPAVAGRPWADAAPEWEQRLLATADRLVPGIAAASTHTEVVTPEDLKALTSDDHGASFGWELTPLASGSARPAPRTPVAGLYLAGKWTQPGGCFLRSTVSGVFASQLVVADAGIDPAAGWQHASLPSLA